MSCLEWKIENEREKAKKKAYTYEFEWMECRLVSGEK